jgi:hypothetical protein
MKKVYILKDFVKKYLIIYELNYNYPNLLRAYNIVIKITGTIIINK